jgi:hypothetical protein
MPEPESVTATEMSLRQVLDDYCQKAGIDENSPDRDAAAARIMTLYTSGVRDLQQIKDALQSHRQPSETVKSE